MAEGAPEAGMAYFTAGDKPEEFIALAWVLEEGSRRFYSEIPALVDDDEVKRLFQRLTTAEEHHKAALVRLYRTFSGQEPGQDFPGSVVDISPIDDVMEGGMRVSEALEWVKDKSFEAVFELAIALETNAFDLYIRMSRNMKDDKSRQVFDQLSREEKKHLELLAGLFEKKY
ncbi:MAG: ferritin family protein [Nitrospirota bacterium]|nr:ferritin family protein [Nitrospirota bacterium]